MKYFINWYPNPPDPRYWDWFQVDGIMVSLAHLKGVILRKAINLGIHRFTGFRGPIFIDSGAFQYSQQYNKRTQMEILELQNWLQPDFIAHLDRPYFNLENIPVEQRWIMLKETIEHSKIARKWEKSRDDAKVVYVIQGWDKESLLICSKKMAALNCNYYGIGSLHRQSIEEILKRVNIVRKFIGESPKLHLFGVNPIKFIENMISNELSLGIDSVDCSSPIRAGIVKEFIDPFDLTRKNIDNFRNICDCPICRQFPYGKYLIGIKGNQRKYNIFRAIHNAYWLTKYARFY